MFKGQSGKSFVNTHKDERKMLMRKYAVMAALLAVAMLLCPLAAVGTADENVDGVPEDIRPVLSHAVKDSAEYITVMSSATGSTTELEMREYLIGCVAAEMPPDYHEEALKAQAVVSYTYAKRITDNSSDFISDSPQMHQGYASKQERLENWGEDFEDNEKKIASAVDAVMGRIVTYDGEAALTVYHSISAGQTQSAQSLWGEDYPYLQSVPGEGDKLSPDFISTVIFTPAEFSQKLGVSAENGEDLVEDVKTENGYVTSAVIGGKTFTGAQIREALELKSNSFEIECTNEKVTVTCKGHGHGVGMSQYGADYMARQGSTWQEILLHYYPSTVIV